MKSIISKPGSTWLLATLAFFISSVWLATTVTIAAPHKPDRSSNSEVPRTTSTPTPTSASSCVASWNLAPSPSIGTLNDIDILSADDIWAISSDGAIYWNGAQWNTTNGGYGAGIAAVSPNEVWSVGYTYNGRFQTRTEHCNGTQWSVIPSPNAGTVGSFLSKVAAVSANDVWAVGTYMTDSTYLTLILHWNGIQWTIVPSPSPSSSYNELSNVMAISANDVWAVGSCVNGPPPYPTLTEHWDGASWSVVPSPNGGPTENYLKDIQAVSANDIWAVGYYGLPGETHPLTMHWDGTQWAVVPGPQFSDAILYGVTTITANDVWAVGLNRVANVYQTLIEHWDGTQWSMVPSPNTGTNDNTLWAVTHIAANDVWAVGYGSDTLIERYVDPCATQVPVATSTITPTPTITPTFTQTSIPTITSTFTRTPIPACGPGSDYLITTSTGAAIVPGTDQVLSACDECTANVSLPFTYTHYGQPFTSAIVGDNGTLGFLANANPAENNPCLPSASFDYAILPHWDTLDMRPFVCDACGIFTSVSGSAPARIFNIEWRACVKVSGICSGNVNFEVRLYENQSHFDIVYGAVDQSGLRATVGTQRGTGTSFTQFSCNTASLSSGLQLTFSQPICPTITPTGTPTNTPTVTPTPTHALVGHVIWQGRQLQLNPLPITLTLKSATTEVNFAQQRTDASGFFIVSVGSLANGTYTWRVKGPNATTPYTNTNGTTGFLANTGTVTLTGALVIQQEMGTMKTADCNNDNVVSALDFNILKPTFGRSTGEPGYDDRADFTGDHVVSALDFNLIKQNFGVSGAPPP